MVVAVLRNPQLGAGAVGGGVRHDEGVAVRGHGVIAGLEHDLVAKATGLDGTRGDLGAVALVAAPGRVLPAARGFVGYRVGQRRKGHDVDRNEEDQALHAATLSCLREIRW